MGKRQNRRLWTAWYGVFNSIPRIPLAFADEDRNVVMIWDFEAYTVITLGSLPGYQLIAFLQNTKTRTCST